jgi:hypothetical protein
MDDREQLDRRLRVLEALLGFVLVGQFEHPRNAMPATASMGEQLRRASDRDLTSLLEWVRDKAPYFSEQQIARHSLTDVRNRVSELEELLAKRASLDLGIDPRVVPLQRFVPVRVWLATDNDEHAIGVSNAVDRLNKTMGLESTYGLATEHGSRFFRWWTRTKDLLTSEEMLERLQKAERAVELAALGRVQADVDQKQASAAAQLIESLKLIPNAVCAVGSILVVKVTDDHGPRVVVRTLTQKQMIALERDDRLVRDPHTLLKHLDELDDVGGGLGALAAGSPDGT